MLFLPLIHSQPIIYTEEERGEMESPWSLPFEILGIEMSSQETKRNAKTEGNSTSCMQYVALSRLWSTAFTFASFLFIWQMRHGIIEMYGFNEKLMWFHPSLWRHTDDIYLIFLLYFDSLTTSSLRPSTPWFSSAFWPVLLGLLLRLPFLCLCLKCFPRFYSWAPAHPSCHVLTSNLDHVHDLTRGFICSSSATC